MYIVIDITRLFNQQINCRLKANRFALNNNQYSNIPLTTRMRFLDSEKDASKKRKRLISESISKETEATFFNIFTADSKVQCDLCEKDISRYVKIYADKCDYCVGCFADLEEWPETYTVVNKLDFPMFDVNWTAEEELLMMDAVERYGFGNWNEIAEQVGTDKTPDDIEKHYERVFLKSPRFLPAREDLLTRRDPETLKLTLPDGAKTETKEEKRMKIYESNPVNMGSAMQRVSLPTTAPSANQTLLNTGNASEVVGFMPKRGDFQVEYDNEAELLLAELEFNDEDTEEEREMKFKILEVYNHRLTERIKRKTFVIDRQLLDVRLQSQLEKSRSKEEREVYNAMKVFARFSTPDEHEKLIQGIIKEKQIRQRIEELKVYRKMGLRNLAEIEQHLEEKQRKEEKTKRAQKAGEPAYMLDKSMSKTSASRRTRGNVPEGTTPEKPSTSGLPAVELKLCEDVGLAPSQYIAIKEALVRESLKKGFIRKEGLDNVLKVDKDKVYGIFDFLVKNGVVLSK